MNLGGFCAIAILAVACSSAESAGTSPSGAGAGGEASGASGSSQAGAPGAGAGGAPLASAGASATGGAESAGASAGVSGFGGSSGGATGDGNGAGASNAGAGPVATPALHWIGRVVSTPAGARLSWPGTGLSARFNGTGAHVSIKTNGVDYLELVLDGQESVLTTQAGTHVYDVAKNIGAGDHSFTLWRRTEPNNGVIEVGAVTFDGSLLAPPTSTKHLEIVGDSISVGFGVECKTQDEAFAFATENNYLTYQALTARKFGAELFSEAWSGIGMWRDVGGSTTVTSQMPDRFTYSAPNDGTKWDFSKYTPDAVVVLLGTNDFAKGDPGQPFVDTYLTFVTDLRMHYPKARLYLAVSPMLGGNNRTLVTAYIEKVIAMRNAAHDMNLTRIEFAQPDNDWRCGHPGAATHALMAGVLEAALSTDLAW